MKQPLILALDIGTSSVRAALYDDVARQVSGARVKIDQAFATTADGGAEMDADEGFARVARAIDALLTKTSKSKAEIGYVASCSFWHSLVGVDARGKPTTKVLGWADTRSRKYSGVLKKRFDEADVHNRTGAQFHSSFWPAKLLWLREQFPDVWGRTTHWLSFSDYVSLKLFGDPSTSVSMASGTGIFDIRTLGWDKQMLRYLKVTPAHLSPIAETDSATFDLNKAFANRWPRLAGASWFPAIADGAADNVGAGCVTRSKAALMVGTSGAMRVCYEGDPPEQVPDGLWCYRLDRKRVVLGGALSDGGGLYQWLKDNLKVPGNAEDEMRRRGAAAHGLMFLPFVAGERSTGYHESATGTLIGLSSSSDAIDILQAAMEGVAYCFAEIFDRLNSVHKVKEVVASGGALRDSPVWTQIIADVLGRDLLTNEVKESSSRGAVLLALESIGKIDSIESLSESHPKRLEYHPACHAIYKLSRKQHQTLYNSILKMNS